MQFLLVLCFLLERSSSSSDSNGWAPRAGRSIRVAGAGWGRRACARELSSGSGSGQRGAASSGPGEAGREGPVEPASLGLVAPVGRQGPRLAVDNGPVPST